MKLTDELARIIPEQEPGPSTASDQLKLADQLEAALRKIGVDVQPRFEISRTVKPSPGKT